MDISRVIYVLRSIRLSGISRTLQNTLIRDRLERGAAQKATLMTSQQPGKLLQYVKIMSGYEFVYEHANLKAEFLTQNMLRFTWGPGKAQYPYTLSTLEWPELPISLSGNSSNTLSLSGEELKVTVSRTGEVCIFDTAEKLIKHDLAPIRNGEQWSISSTLSPGECIYGLGERANTLNLRPGTYTSWNTDPAGTYTRGSDPLYIGTPIFLSHSPAGSYLVYFENSFAQDSISVKHWKQHFLVDC